MAKTQRFERPTIWVEAARNWDGMYFLAWKPNSSKFFADRKSLLKWVAWPVKTPTGDELRIWLDGLEVAPAATQPATAEPTTM